MSGRFQAKVVESIDGVDILNVLHLSSVFGCIRTVGSSQNRLVQKCGDRSTVLQVGPLANLPHMFALREEDPSLCSVPVYLHAYDVSGLALILEYESLRKLLFSPGMSFLAAARHDPVVHVDSQKLFVSVTIQRVDAVVALAALGN